MTFHPALSRRDALKRLALAAATLPCTTGLLRAQVDLAGWKTAVGLNGFMSAASKYNKTFPIREILAFARDTGFEGVELVQGWPSGNYPAARETDRIRALKDLYTQFGLRVFSIQLGVADAFDPKTETRRAWLAEFRDRAALARQLGCDAIGMWPGGDLRGQTLDEAIERLAGSFHEAGRMAADHGLLAAFEIEPPFVFNTEDHLRRILHGADHPSLKYIYDPSHFDLMSGSQGKPHEMLRRLGVDRVGYVHLTDTDGTLRDGGTSKHLACGEGHARIPESLKTLREGGFRGWIMIDAWEIPDPYDACRKGMQAMRDAWS